MDASKKVKEDLSPAEAIEPAKVIAEIKINWKVEDFRLQALEAYQTCCLCGSELDFAHVTHFVNNEVEEEAYCSCCGVRNRKQTHKLQ